MTTTAGRVLRNRAQPSPSWIAGQTRAWQELKVNYPQLYRHELAHAEEGPRAGADGWVHARR